jgi:hypothetical protein
MEEEALIASEKFALEQTVAAETRATLAAEQREAGPDVRAEVEAELRVALAREAEERQAALEKTWRAREQGLRSELVRELEGRIESDLRRRLEKEIRAEIEGKLRSGREQADHDLTPRIEVRVPPGVERRALASRLALSSRGTPGPTPTPRARPLTPSPAAPRAGLPSAAPPPEAELPAEPASSAGTEHPADAQAPPSAAAPEGSSGDGRASGNASRAAGNLRAAGDVHARAQRRARVIVSDLSLYERATLLKASHAEDAKQVLGVLWRDALRSYTDAVPADIRAATNYLEEELGKCLAELRRR